MDRGYQQQMLHNIITEIDANPGGSSVAIAATGTGKGRVIGKVARALYSRTSHPSVILAPTEEIVDQLAAHVRNAFGEDVPVGIEQGARSTTTSDSRAIIASLKSFESAARRDDVLSRINGGLSGVLCDEAHHFATPLRREILKSLGYGQVPTVGFTATFDRSYNPKDLLGVFPHVSFAYHMLDAIREGWIADIVPQSIETGISLADIRSGSGDYNQEKLLKAINTERRNALAVDAYREHLEGKNVPLIAFCGSVEHANALQDLMVKAGVRAASLTTERTAAQRQAIVEEFRTGRLPVITAYGIPLEGFDTDTKAIFWMRPTLLEHVYTQGLGRAIRPPFNAVNELNAASGAEERRAIIREHKGDALVFEFLDTDPERVNDRAGIANITELRSDFVFDGKDSLGTISRYCQSIVSVNPKQFLHIRNSEELRRSYLSPSNNLMRMAVIPDAQRRAALPPILNTKEVTLDGALSWHVMGPGRFATAMMDVSQSGDIVRKSAATVTRFGSIWVAQQHEGRDVSIIGNAESFDKVAVLVAQHAEARQVRNHHHILRLDGSQAREFLEAQLLSTGHDPNAVALATSDGPDVEDRVKALSSYTFLQSVVNTEPYIQALQQEQARRSGVVLDRRYLLDRMDAVTRRESLGDIKKILSDLQQHERPAVAQEQTRPRRTISNKR